MAQAVRLICVGKLKEDFYRAAAAEYIKRLGRFGGVEITELAEARIGRESDAEIAKALEAEGLEIVKRLSGRVVLLDIGGKQMSSPELAGVIDESLASGGGITFVIGSSHGVCEAVKSKADIRLSFGRITYPHQLIRVVVLEQIYRGFSIINKTPYHK